MIYALYLSWRSLMNRRTSTALTVISLALSVCLLIGISKIRDGARQSFQHTISQTDLIVGAKGGTIQLLLYSVFRIGTATDNVSYQSFQEYSRHPDVAWTIPYSLGDSHNGYRVVGTNADFYQHYRYRRDQSVVFASGTKPGDLFDVVLGSEVAETLGYRLGDRVVLAHGIDAAGFQQHGDKPFRVVGVLGRTNTPIDKSLYVSLEAIEAIHSDWTDGAPPLEGSEATPDHLRAQAIEIKQITAFLVGAKSRLSTLKLQREINDYRAEALMAIIPGVALSELWEAISYAELALIVVSGFVVLVGLLGMVVTIYQTLNERRREMAILRAIGAGSKLIFALMILESTVLTATGIVLGVVSTYGLLWLLQPLVEANFGFYLPISMLSLQDMIFLAIIMSVGCVLGALPAWRAYRNTLQDGLTIRV